MDDFDDLFPAGPAPQHPGIEPFTVDSVIGHCLTVVPVSRIGDPVDPGGEHVWLEITTGRFAGKRFRVPLAGGPEHFMRLQGRNVELARRAPHIIDLLG